MSGQAGRVRTRIPICLLLCLCGGLAAAQAALAPGAGAAATLRSPAFEGLPAAQDAPDATALDLADDEVSSSFEKQLFTGFSARPGLPSLLLASQSAPPLPFAHPCFGGRRAPLHILFQSQLI